jgi:protein tyrosine phosphatase type 4A
MINSTASLASTKITTHEITTETGFIFVVTQSPDSNNIEHYKNLLLNKQITTVVKLCEPNHYDQQTLTCAGIKITNIPIDDGSTPSSEELKSWINIIKSHKHKENGIAVHCVSGLGRAPLFVCVGLIKVYKVDSIDAIQLVRKHIKNALNHTQLKYLENLDNSNNSGCIIS